MLPDDLRASRAYSLLHAGFENLFGDPGGPFGDDVTRWQWLSPKVVVVLESRNKNLNVVWWRMVNGIFVFDANSVVEIEQNVDYIMLRTKNLLCL